jgi:hypothetical protein
MWNYLIWCERIIHLLVTTQKATFFCFQQQRDQASERERLPFIFSSVFVSRLQTTWSKDNVITWRDIIEEGNRLSWDNLAWIIIPFFVYSDLHQQRLRFNLKAEDDGRIRLFKYKVACLESLTNQFFKLKLICNVLKNYLKNYNYYVQMISLNIEKNSFWEEIL